jgi:TPR repeat protein
MNLYLMAALQGVTTAQTNVGIMYLNGMDVATNQERAREWLTKARLQREVTH